MKRIAAVLALLATGLQTFSFAIIAIIAVPHLNGGDKVISVYRTADGVLHFQQVDMVTGEKLALPDGVKGVFLDETVYTLRPGDNPPPPPNDDDPTPSPPGPQDPLTKAIASLSQQYLHAAEAQVLIAALDQIRKSDLPADLLVTVLDIAIPQADAKINEGRPKDQRVDVVGWYKALKKLGAVDLDKTIAGLAAAFGLNAKEIGELATAGRAAMENGLDLQGAAQSIARETEEVFDIALILEIVRLVLNIIDLIKNRIGLLDEKQQRLFDLLQKLAASYPGLATS